MKLKLEINGRIPSKKNSKEVSILKTGVKSKSRVKVKSSPQFYEWHNLAVEQVSKYPRCELKKTKSISILIFFPDKHRADLTNKAESIMDLLVDCGIIKDDSWDVVGELRLSGKLRKGFGGAEVIIDTGSKIVENWPAMTKKKSVIEDGMEDISGMCGDVLDFEDFRLGR